MPLRMSPSSYGGGVPYNPQEWLPVNVVGSPQIGQVATSHRSHAIRQQQQQQQPLPVLRGSGQIHIQFEVFH
jgi:hypothetical protein